ncbi:P2Y purinoceptor 4 [Labeo rohita]|uniref:P2Y purinoceptor 4 n=1 Tax=Labeo rohita TaxID=84645 RepID=A0ABQ8MQL7_LABRO|nr:P2Y purinoceptor 4 [Labeo rohita]
MNSAEFSSNTTSGDISVVCPMKPQHISISVLICLTFLVGLLLNVFSLWVFTCKTPEWTSNTVFQVHLAVSDVIICPMGPFMAVYYHTANWPFGKALCQLKIALMTFHIYSSILFLTLISIHRYVVVVCYNQDSYMNRKNFVQKLCFGVWLLVLVKGTVLAMILDTSTVNNHTLCLSIHQDQYTNSYFIANFSVLIPGLLLAFTVSVICYSLLWHSSKMNTSDSLNASHGVLCSPEPQHISLAVILCLVYLLGLLLNGFSLWVFTCRIHSWTSGVVLQFNLALSDAIIAPLTPLMAVYFASDSNWVFGNFTCQLKIAVLSIHFNGSVIFLTLISVHRYMSVVHFNRSSLIKRKVFVKKLFAWRAQCPALTSVLLRANQPRLSQ